MKTEKPEILTFLFSCFVKIVAQVTRFSQSFNTKSALLEVTQHNFKSNFLLLRKLINFSIISFKILIKWSKFRRS